MTNAPGDGDDADNAVQNAYVRADRHLASDRQQDRFGAWFGDGATQ